MVGADGDTDSNVRACSTAQQNTASTVPRVSDDLMNNKSEYLACSCLCSCLTNADGLNNSTSRFRCQR